MSPKEEYYHLRNNPFSNDDDNHRLWLQYLGIGENDGYMGGSMVNFTEMETTVTGHEWFYGLERWQQAHPGMLESLRTVLEPGAGSAGMMVQTYDYFRRKVFPKGFPPDFHHLGLEITDIKHDWYQQQVALEQVGFPLVGQPSFENHYSIQKNTDYLDYAKDPRNFGKFDAVIGISIYDLLADFQHEPNLFTLTRKLLKPGGIFFLVATNRKTLGDNPEEAGFRLISDMGHDRHDTYWQAV